MKIRIIILMVFYVIILSCNNIVSKNYKESHECFKGYKMTNCN
jgi:uncharacterized protein YpmB